MKSEVWEWAKNEWGWAKTGEGRQRKSNMTEADTYSQGSCSRTSNKRTGNGVGIWGTKGGEVNYFYSYISDDTYMLMIDNHSHE